MISRNKLRPNYADKKQNKKNNANGTWMGKYRVSGYTHSMKQQVKLVHSQLNNQPFFFFLIGIGR